MKRVTKAEARAQRAAWSKALAEGRVIRCGLPGDRRLISYPTFEMRDAALAAARAAGIPAEIVNVSEDP